MQMLDEFDLPHEQAQLFIRSKKHLYEALSHKGYCLPDIKSRLVTVEFLKAVKRGVCFCPKFPEITMKACLHPPPVYLLQEMLVKELTEYS